MQNSILVRNSTLKGSIRVSGSKNAALPIIISTLLTNQAILRNIPTKLLDIKNILQILEHAGSMVEVNNDCLNINNTNLNLINFDIMADLANKTRASLWLLAPMLIRLGQVTLPMPGGCKLNTGPRMIDLHINILRQMGAKIDIKNNLIIATLDSKKFHGTDFTYRIQSVGATITGILAAVQADGETNLYNCAQEPEIVDLCNFLNSIGANIKSIGTSDLAITGVEKLNSNAEYTIISDRIEACTYIFATAATNGSIILTNIDIELLDNLQEIFRNMGIGVNYETDMLISAPHIEPSDLSFEQDLLITPNPYGVDPEIDDYAPPGSNSIDTKIEDEYTQKGFILVKRTDDRLFGLDISTGPYPQFSTDLQPLIMSALITADGESNINENIFDNRFTHVAELKKMGAKITLNDKYHATINPVRKLHGAEVNPNDLRSAAALVIAGLVADSSKHPTKIKNAYHLYRGYEDMVEKLISCGANVEVSND